MHQSPQNARQGTNTGRAVNRRDFIKVTALAAGAGLLGAAGIRRLLSEGELKTISVSRILMGAVANLTLVAPSESSARPTLEAAFALMQDLESQLSRCIPASDLCRLNRHGKLRAVRGALRQVLARAQAYARLTGGAFDVSLEPLLALYRRSARQGESLPYRQIDAAQRLVDYRQIEITPGYIALGSAGMAINLDGIAKGYIIDQGADFLRRAGYPNVLVEVGGDLSAYGTSRERPWRIGIQSPDYGDQMLAVAQIQDQALATSGDYVQAYTPDRRLNHIIDPRTGVSAPELSSVSVLAPTACDADALSTSLMVLGVERGLALVERLPSVEAALFTKDRQLLFSSGFPRQA